eukprot:Gregarina_sp_Poly_1__9913@NODE_64_length_16522_cov_117_152963_g55_i0_p5_GENE_NODE_64_length_16522_cov_117_152963_g55_i0NODE_64_length_16522_cov_117_152963_g55_i0_p5_ORF_typecomplete_len434_score57_60Adap_comp_sub/PF00928_21/2_9e90Clat_adaptor_s/PF01217_20/1_9e22Glyco_transf_36/PF06165_11/0_0055Longin/PF13774_6/0_047Longin/PF13774_6/2_9e03_NODE_64_length_16522_cov_117_152963_g55_i055726873
MASAILLLDTKGQSILARDFRGEVPLAQVPEKFAQHVVFAEESEVKPIFSDDGVTYCWLKRNDIYAVAVTRTHVNAAMLMTFLKRVCDLFTQFYSKLEEDSVRDNFVVTYELLDELMDNGYPQLTEPKVLRKLITSASAKQHYSDTAKAPTCITNAVSWRAEGIKHKKNEIFLDVIERIDCLVGNNSQLLNSEIHGKLMMKSYLSGMPELKLGLNDKAVNDNNANGKLGCVELEDVRFHHCVRLNKYESDRTISFVPPDGEFELMTYRLTNFSNEEARLPFWIECTLSPNSFDPNSTRVEYLLKIKSTFKPRSIASTVEVKVPAPRDASSPLFKTSSGSVKYHPDKQAFIWTLKQFQGQREQLLTASLSRLIGQNIDPDVFHKRPIELSFEIPYFTLSGITVKYLRIHEVSGYQALPWVRYITQNGSYQVRIS